MKIDNKIQRTFPGPLTIIGITFLVLAFGFVISGIWYFGVSFFIFSLFFLFTYSGVTIDTEKRQIRPYYMVFGLLKRGKWIPIEHFVGLTLVPMQKVYSMYSNSNRKNDSVSKDFRVYLVDHRKRPAYAIKACKTEEQAQNSMDEFAIWLHLPVYSVKKHF